MWPLVPLVWAMAPAGLAAARGAGVTGRVATGGLAAAAAALCAWQGAAALAMVRDNGAWRREGERFYERRVPPLYFADWRAAGSWLGAHAPRGTRVLTRHSDTGFASGLSQESARFEELPPPIWRARIAQLSARYLAVPTTLYGRFFPLELLRSDPVYTYEVVWRGRDVAVVEVRPNRNGRVEPAPPPSPEVQAACAQALAREPRRVDLAARCAELDAAAGRRDEAIARLRELIATGGADVRLHVALAQMLLDAGKDAEAAAAFTTASALPEAELLEQTIARGRSAALERAGTRSIDMDVRARQAVGRARDDMERLRWAEAYAKVGEALGLAPDDPVVLRAAGDLALPLGALDRAVAFYEAAGARGDGASAERAAGLRDALAVERAFETAAPEAVTRAAIFWGKAGAPGRALDLLERAAGRLAADEGVARRLAEARRFFGHPPP